MPGCLVAAGTVRGWVRATGHSRLADCHLGGGQSDALSGTGGFLGVELGDEDGDHLLVGKAKEVVMLWPTQAALTSLPDASG